MDRKISDNYIKIGRLSRPIAQAAHLRAADIYISIEHIRHIEKKHNKELSTLGFTAIQYVNLILDNFNEIREGNGTAIMFVIAYNEADNWTTAVLDINYCTKKGIWEVRTAQPRRNVHIKKRKLLWKRS